MPITFTRYLYNIDEVILTFLECLLKQNNLEECYYWFYEYYKSGYVEESWNLLWKIYYDFYMIKNPKIEEKIEYKLFDRVIAAWKVDGKKYEEKRTSHDKKYEDLIEITNELKN